MFEQFAGCWIAELEISLYFPQHIPMFALCAKYRIWFLSPLRIFVVLFTMTEYLSQHDITKTREE